MRLATLSFAVGLIATPAITQELGLDDKARATVAKTIQFYNFNCPSAKKIANEGDGPYGKVYKVWCGAANGPINKKLIFTVTIRPSGNLAVAPATSN